MREIQIKIIRHHHESIRMAKLKDKGIKNIAKDAGQLELLFLAAGNVKWCNFFGKHFGNFLKAQSENSNTLIIDNGDTWQGTFESNYEHGYVVQDVFGDNANIGNVKMLGIRDNIYSSCIGNLVYFISKC